jgi:hypothetical protein
MLELTSEPDSTYGESKKKDVKKEVHQMHFEMP